LTSTARIPGVADDALLGPVLTLLRARLLRDRGDAGAARRLLAGRSTGPAWLLALGDAEARALGLHTIHGADGIQDRVRPLGSESISQQVEGLLGQAQQRIALGDRKAGGAYLMRAITLAQREDIRRPFRHVSPSVMAVIDSNPLLAAQAGSLRRGRCYSTEQPARHESSPDIVTELTTREMEVLRHLAELLTTEEIAATMFISINTVRTHVRSILAKLSVSRRNDAIRRARALSLL
jgi:LuxR family transcriptional regulator, maltose regulon positive regulatory protein